MRTIALFIGTIALSVMTAGAVAQGRHDEKPHGMMKPSASQDKERKTPPMTGGRHDERPHGMTKKPPADTEKK